MQKTHYLIQKPHLINRFISYVTVDTESDPESKTTPSTEKQWNLANALVEELKRIGFDGPTTLEVFGEDALKESAKRLRSWFA